MKIIANHAHIFQKEVREDGTVDALKNFLDECEIDKAVCFAPFSNYFNSNGESPSRWMYEQIKNDDRLLAFGTIDFTKDNVAEQTEEIYQMGLSGIKMHAAFQKFKLDEEKACKVYEVAEKRGMPISFHTGIHWHRISSYNTLLYDEIAYKFPNLKICMEHVGGYHFFNEAMAVMSNNGKRIYAGLTSVLHKDTHKYWYLGKDKIKDLIWMNGIDQCVFGLDFPYTKPSQIKDAIVQLNECVEEMDLGEEAKTKVFGKNLLRMIETK
ncbi:MAG: amidohydrolase family protein [Clostridia bacterium]|nr:amidohydrolase family protein [Clostridia bacterium]